MERGGGRTTPQALARDRTCPRATATIATTPRPRETTPSNVATRLKATARPSCEMDLRAMQDPRGLVRWTQLQLQQQPSQPHTRQVNSFKSRDSGERVVTRGIDQGAGVSGWMRTDFPIGQTNESMAKGTYSAAAQAPSQSSTMENACAH